jgi:Tfp pilus assembly protein PilN
MNLNFARRPFRDYRPVYLLAGGALLAGVILFAVNATLYGEFRRTVADTREEIAWLEKRLARATQSGEEARSALRAYENSALAVESRGLLRLVSERQFSWMALLAQLERVLPAEVRLTRLQPSFQDPREIVVDIALVGRGPESVVRTLAALARSTHFTAMELKSETRSDAADGAPEGHSFVITTTYDPEATP